MTAGFRIVRPAGAVFAAAAFLVTSASADWVNAGGRGTVPDASGFEAPHPIKAELARAGVVGGIPDISFVKATLSPGDNIQSAIDNGGAGVVLLNAGTYIINNPIHLDSGVIVRGVNRDSVTLSVKITSTSKLFAFQFYSSTAYAGLERLTISYDATTQFPIDRSSVNNGAYYPEAFQNDPYGLTNLYVGMVSIAGNNNWINEVRLLKSGTDPVLISGRNNTFRNSIIDRCYNKGDGGNGYFDLRGDWNFVGGNTIKRIRHFAVQLGARYNVVLENLLEVDVNFHNGDDGKNLIERNVVNKPSWHGWRCFGTGSSAYGHAPPGPGNVIFNNDAWDYEYGYAPANDPNKSYTFLTFGEPTVTSWAYPSKSTFHVVKFLPSPWSAGDIGWNGTRGLISENSGTWTLQGAGADGGGTADDLLYVWRPITGDIDISLKVVSLENTNPWAKAGVMIRETLAEDSRHVSHFLSVANGTRTRFRSSTGGGSSGGLTDGNQSGSAWVRLIRVGNKFTFAVKQNTKWVPVGTTTQWMWPQGFVGFFVSSQDANVLADATLNNFSVSAPKDSDGDGLTDVDEWERGTDADDSDSDDDGLTDGDEVNVRNTNPLDWDSDDDDIGDGTEVNVYGSDPKNDDTDGDGLKDGAEINIHNTSPTVNDSDHDGFDDGMEVNFGSDPSSVADTPLAHVIGTDLINATRRNGSFEFLGGVFSTAKATHWDTDPDGDVDDWSVWNSGAGGPSTVSNDSGTNVLATATHGTRAAFLQPGNAAYNATDYLIAAGDRFVFTWDWVRAGRGPATAQLAYRNGSQIIAIDAVGTSSTGVGNVQTYGSGWIVPSGHPAIGKPVAITLRTSGNYPEVDMVRLLVAPASGIVDLDGDQMDDSWEAAHGLAVGSNDAAQDLDQDGTTNLTEFRLGLLPDDGGSRFAISTEDSDPSDGFTFSWPSKPGLVFTIRRCTGLNDWSIVTSTKNADAGTNTSFTDLSPPPPGGRHFYQVGLNP